MKKEIALVSVLCGSGVHASGPSLFPTIPQFMVILFILIYKSHSKGDVPMLLAVGHPYWVCEVMPVELEGKCVHVPDGDIGVVAERIMRSVGG